MHFHKYPYAANFEFAAVKPSLSLKTRRGAYRVSVRATAADIYHIQVTGKGWQKGESQAGLRLHGARKGGESRNTRLEFGQEGQFRLLGPQGEELLSSLPGRFLGQCGEASLFEFLRQKSDRFYGMGEKWSGLEHSEKTTKFWNTDVWADFNPNAYVNGKPAPDPVYVSIPYLIINREGTWLGLLLDNPFATFISTGAKVSIADQLEVSEGSEELAEVVAEGSDHPLPAKRHEAPKEFIHIGAEEGLPSLYIIYGPTLPELTRKLQTLTGTTPRPPAWALGYHQCRWGYESEKDLLWLDGEFRKHEIPVDGLWLDIDYMRGYRVFTFEKKHFPKPKEALARLAKAGRKVVPIIDPGVKLEKGYDVYERGRKANAYCRNPQGGEYVGLVWPGQTVFPDFSMPKARAWWAKEVQAFAEHGIPGAWLDMNDPATGASDNGQMLFAKGTKSHATYHNQFALGMAMASREGFLAAHPGQRPFLLSRSGFIGSNRYTAIWTGDNYSNYHHLKNSIPTTLNLALSGIPFNGPDAGGFGGDTTPELIRDWYKAGFLFPFFRNHSIINSRQQEPWAFDARTLKVLRHYVRLRYRFRPYLYQLFIEHERTGEAILRPLFYDFASTPELPLDKVDDQFLAGPLVLQAPFVQEQQAKRELVLPGGTRWLDASTGRWQEGGQRLTVTADPLETPLYLRDGAILPLAQLEPHDHAFRGESVDFHILLSEDSSALTRYVFDDGATLSYADGKYSEVRIAAQRKGKEISITTETLKEGFGPGQFVFSTPTEIRKVTINGEPARRRPAAGVAVGKIKTASWAA